MVSSRIKDVIPLSGFNSFDKALAWLQTHEPQCYGALAEHRERKCDFHVLKKLAFGCRQMYSEDRWCLLGNAGTFHDPFYSPGSDVIAFNNTYATALIESDLAGENISCLVERYNELFFRYLVEPLFRLYEDKYLLMANSQVFSVKIIWDDYWYWAVPCLIFFQDKLTDLALVDSVEDDMKRSTALSERMQSMFIQWDELDKGSKVSGQYVDLNNFTTLTKAHDEMGVLWSDEDLRTNIARNVDLLEGLAKEIFWRAVRVLPDPPPRRNINPYAIGLDPKRWEEDGLFIDGPEKECDPVLQKELSGMWFEPRYR